MIGSLFEHVQDIERPIAAADSLLLLLDFDGTLTPLVPAPERAQLTPAVRRLLQALAGLPSVTLAVISGRERTDLQERVRIQGITYAGNHGLEISGPGVLFIEPQAAEHAPTLKEVRTQLEKRIEPIAGAFVEDKGLTLSVHYRQATADDSERVRQAVHSALAQAAYPFQLTAGDKVYEIRPRVDWNKGSAVGWIRQHLAPPDALPVYLGDDLTDEDAFAALPQGITVKVGNNAAKTLARYWVVDPDEVHRFLEWLRRNIR